MFVAAAVHAYSFIPGSLIHGVDMAFITLSILVMQKRDTLAAFAAIIMYSYMDALTMPYFGGGLCAGLVTFFVFKFIYANFYKENFIARSVIMACGAATAVSLQWMSASLFYWGIGSAVFPFSAVKFFMATAITGIFVLKISELYNGEGARWLKTIFAKI
ncbi:MAG: hypothetical protein CVV21_06795 [Candidatus Goldiibacteriota bacterium HGW-Goldbacteria-1]|jgi:hypothetical protein|nr:MAG: hypothetical protein CVV21_06795 [Candidatus Goldiibacteriota bacterium HGW-Goldbacteria-1]